MCFVRGAAQAQRYALKTNLLYDATATFNIGGEVVISLWWTADLSASYNPWTFSNDKSGNIGCCSRN